MQQGTERDAAVEIDEAADPARAILAQVEEAGTIAQSALRSTLDELDLSDRQVEDVYRALEAADVRVVADYTQQRNLQRQVIHSTDRIGMPKAESAQQTLTALNPDVEVVQYRERLSSANIDRILEGYDVVVDGTDNFPTRYLLNDASLKHRVPVVHASIFRFEGQLTVFKPYEGPCYRCLFPEPPPVELAPSCAEGGVLGVLPGIMGTLQATEALKLILGIGEPLVGRLLLADALDMTFHEVQLRRDPSCPVCGEHPTITEYVDYVEFCSR